MKHYFKYMDEIEVSDTLHQRLLNLETPRKRPAAWKMYGAAAAVLALVVGVGAWGLSQSGWDAISRNFHPQADAVLNTSMPEIADIGEPAQPDIAAEDPNSVAEPGMKTDGGYEIIDEGAEITSYYVLPYIEYGMAENVTEMALDWDLPKGSVRRDLTRADMDALFGGAGNLPNHLAWSDYELTGWAAWLEDGSFWGLFINGYMGELDHFEFALTAGNTIPPTCIGYLDGVEQDIWGLSVTAYGNDSVASPSGGVDASHRRVEFLNDGYGFRFDITGGSRSLTQERVGRLVRWIATEGLALDAITADGAELVHPWEAGPNYSVGEPNWEDGVSEWDSDCPYCADGTVHTHPYDPQEAADPSYNAPSAETRSPGSPNDN